MSFLKLTISDFIDQQLPDFVVNEFPIFVKFFEEYYKSLEVKGGVLDISQNIIEYKDFAALTKNNLISTSSLYQNINESQDTIRLTSINGFEKSQGVVQIDDEIIFYASVDEATNTLLNCSRGYSATTKLQDIGTYVTTSTASSHNSNTTVTNLSNLFLFAILKNYEEQYLQGFPSKRIDSDIDIITILENIKDFYSFKGTSISIEFLFRSIFDEEITVKYPKDYVIKSSYSDWTVDDIIKVESISGDPYTLIGSEIVQSDATGQVATSSIVDSILVNNITNYSSGNKNIFELRLNILNRQNFTVPNETIVRRNITASSNTITVDSTIGFPEENGVIQIDDEIIVYRFKSFNQFYDCARGSYNTVAATHQSLVPVRSTEYLYGYSGGVEDASNLVKMRLLGVVSSTDNVDGASYYNDNEFIKISESGVVDTRKQFTTWRINEIGNTASSSEPQINNAVKDYLTEIGAVYKTDKFAYISSTGLPNHPIGSFRDTGTNVGNQYLLKTIPLQPEKITQIQPVGNRSVGLFVNGVEAYSCQDLEYENFGDIVSVEITDGGYGFLDNVQPVFRILNSSGSGATFSATISNARISSINVINGGNNYTSDIPLEVAYGFDATASIVNDIDIQNGKIKTITVTNGGNNYIIPPNVLITDITGRGNGAFARANVTNGVVTSIDVIAGGIDYTDKSNIRVSLISQGFGVVATAKVRKWNYDRVFKLRYTRNNNIWQLDQNRKTDDGNGYLYPSSNIAYGLQYAYAHNPKLLRSVLGDNVRGPSFDYSEISSGFVHSPILGWAYDGNPIYGPYGYSDSNNSSSSIRRITSSYQLISSIPATRPNTTSYPLGAFIEDYEFIAGNGDLDENNGRYCITPDYPNGTYAYFLTVDVFGFGVFPYILGKTYNSVPSRLNSTISHIQKESFLPVDAKRIRTLLTPNKGFDATILVNNVERGSVDSFICSSSQPEFKVGDFLYVNNDNSEGSGAFGSVETIFGVTVSSVTYSVSSGYTASGITISGGFSQYPFPTIITAPQNIQYEATVTTSAPHGLSNNDVIVLKADNISLQTTRTFKVRTGSYQTVNYVIPNIVTTLDADVSFNQTTINVINASQYKNNDYIIINDEILRIVSINYPNNQFTVLRSQLNSPLRLHAATNTVRLYIPESDNHYRIQVGDAINSPGISGVIYSIDKNNSRFEVKVLSGTLSNTSIISDSSLPSSRQIQISSITSKKTYWEIDPSNTGSYFVRDLSFNFIKGTRYIFDISDGSNLGYLMSFSEDSSNINSINNIIRTGIPGTAGSTIIFNYDLLLNSGTSRVYYYDSSKRIQNNLSFFSVGDNYFEGRQNVIVTSPTTFKFAISSQLENTYYTNVSYYTTSISAVGVISTIRTLDGGEGYKKLPYVEGVYHSDIDNARFVYSLSSGSIEDNISVIDQGRRYTTDTTIKVVSATGTGAILRPTILNGRIISVEVLNGGRNYSESDRIIAIDTSPQIFPVSESIGKIKTTRFANYGTQYSIDRTLSKQLIFTYKLIATNFSGQVYDVAELISASNGAVAVVTARQQIGVKSYLIEVELISGELETDTILTGYIRQTTSTIYDVKSATIFGNIGGYLSRVGYFDSDLGKLNSSSQKIIDSYYYQDFSYIIRSTKSLKDYKQLVDRSTHPLGFKLFGEVAIESDGSITNSGLTGTGSVTLPGDYSDNTIVLITASGINVESQLTYRRYEVQTIRTSVMSTIDGDGSALLNFQDNQIESLKLSSLTNSFDGSATNFSLNSQDGNFPIGYKNTSVLLAINEIFQEPYETKDISSINYVNNIATVTTTGDHGYAYSVSGVTYPVDLYVHISGVVPSGNINFNDKFEVYSVDSSNTFTILFNNPNGIVTNNDPGVCADVQSTVDNLIGILTNKVSNPSGFTLPVRNPGIWTSSGVSTIVSANRHRDASNLIRANRQEIIDRSNAEISILFPDFYYPNDPQTTQYSRYKDSYRLIQLNKQEIIDGAFAAISGFTGNPNPSKCRRDIGYFIDSISLDVHTGGNRYSIEFLKQYFNANGSSLTSNGLQGEIPESIIAFNRARDLMKSAITNQLTVKDLTLTPDPSPASGLTSNTNPTSCTNVRDNIDNLTSIVSFYLNQGSLLYPTALPAISSGVTTSGETKCKRDLGYIVDAVVLDLFYGGNSNIIDSTNAYLTASGNTLLPNGLSGEVSQSVVAFNKARDVMKLALANQLYVKDFSILADFVGTSGTISPSRLSNAKIYKGQFEVNNTLNSLTLYEPPKEGSTFYSVIYKMTNSTDDARYSYKLKNILFDGVTKTFNLYKNDGSPLITDQDENLLIFIDGVLQIYGESYSIDRTVFPNKIIFTEAFNPLRNFFGYSFSKYKILNDISSNFTDTETVFELSYLDDIIKLPDIHQLMILLDGVPQVEGDTYSISDNILTFREAPTSGKKCHLLYFYGKTFDKTISIWNGQVFDEINYIGENTADGCRYLRKSFGTYEYIRPGDLIKIEGETPKEVISIEQNVLENSDNYVYTGLVYTDNSYVRGKNAVATAVVSGIPVDGANTITVSGTVTISGTVGVPTVYNYQVIGVDVNNGGLEYSTAPIVVFKTECDNPGRGAEAYSTIQNGRVVSVTVTNPGSGYTSPPEVIFAKKYEIVRQKYPVYDYRDIIVDLRANDGQSLIATTGFSASTTVGSEERYELPIVQTQLSSSYISVIQTENKTNSDTSRPALAYVLQTFDQNKFKYEPLNLNDPLSSYIGTNVNIQNVSRYAPTLTIGDFTTRAGTTTGSGNTPIINYAEDAYVSFGLVVASGINNSATAIRVSGRTQLLPPSGYVEFGNELIYYTSISGVTLLNCSRGVLGTTATSHTAGKYVRLAWRG